MSESTPSSQGMAPVPKCISLILCESAFPIGGTANQILVNTFVNLGVSACPCTFPKITAFFTLTNGHARYELVLSLIHAASGRTVMENRHGIDLRNPLGLIEEIVVLLNVPLPDAGKYWAEVRCGGELIGQRPFFVTIL